MFEFGAGFDDDLFGQTKDRSKKKTLTYEAQILKAKWFLDAPDEGSKDECNQYKFAGDWAYRNKDYLAALNKYAKCIDLIDRHSSLHRELIESLARCHTHMGCKREALEFSQKAISSASNFEQKTVAVQLQCFVFEKFDMITNYLGSLQKLLTLHPGDSAVWFNIASTYERLSSASDIESQYDYTIISCTDTGFKSLNTFTCVCISSVSDSISNELAQGKELVTSVDNTSGVGTSVHNSEIKEEVLECCDMDLYKTFSCCKCGLLKELTCWYRTQLILRGEHNAVHSFAKEKNKELQAKVRKKLEDKVKLIPTAVSSLCFEYISNETYNNEEDIVAVGDKHLLSILPNSQDVFESKWFSWMYGRTDLKKETVTNTQGLNVRE